MIKYKLKNYLLMGMCFYTSIGYASTQDEDAYKRVEEIRGKVQMVESQLIEDMEKLTTTVIGKKQPVIIIGLTGEGKSTFTNFLAGKSLKAIRGRSGCKLDLNDPNQGLRIGVNISSCTEAPSYLMDDNYIYYDTPGFFDNRDNEAHDIRNMYSIKRLFELLENPKVLIAVSEISLVNKSIGFQSLLEILGGVFKDNIKDLVQGSSLVITRQQDFINIADVKGQLEDIINTEDLNIKTEGKLLLEELMKLPDSQFCFFPKPRQEDSSYLDLGTLRGREVYNNALNALKSASPISKITPHLNVADPTRKEASRIAKSLSEEVETLISKDIVEGIYSHSLEVIQQDTGEDIAVLRKQLKGLRTSLKQIKTSDLQAFKVDLKKSLKENSLEKSYDDIANNIDQIEYLKVINPAIEYSLRDWKQGFSSAIKALKGLKKTPKIKPNGHGTLRVKGTIVGISDVNKFIEDNNLIEKIKDITVFSTNALLIDENMKYPSALVKLVAPHWKIKGERVIDLSGENGLNGTNEINGGKGQNGGNGEPGKPGANGGSFIGFGNDLDLSKLTVNTSGGQGGDGGTGGNGGKGKDGIKGDVNSLKAHQGISLVSSTKFEKKNPTGEFQLKDKNKRWIAKNEHRNHAFMDGVETLYTHGNLDGDPGHKGGDGGARGKGGYKGKCVIKGFDVKEQSEEGRPGKNGKGGAGGSTGPIVKGIHITGMKGDYEHHWDDKLAAIWPCYKDDHWLETWIERVESSTAQGEDGQKGKSGDAKAPEAQLNEREFEDIKKKGLKEYKKFHTKRKADLAHAPFVLPFQP